MALVRCEAALGHAKPEPVVWYLGIDLDDALKTSDQIQIWRWSRCARQASMSQRAAVHGGDADAAARDLTGRIALGVAGF